MRDRTFIGLVALVIAICLLPVVGYGMNIYKLCHLDFESPFKAEIIRSIGVGVPPVGFIVGFCEINDDKEIIEEITNAD